MTTRRGFLSSLGVVALTAAGCGVPAARTVRGETMGTYFKVVLADELDDADMAHISRAVQQELGRLTSRISAYHSNAELAQLNAAKPGVWQPVGKSISTLVEQCRQLANASDGAFDATVGPLVELWGFGTSAHHSMRVPEGHAIDAAKALTRFSAFDIDLAKGRATRLHPDARLDVDGIGKGYGVDTITHMLDRLGLGNFLVEIGGEVRTRGERADGGDWQIGVAHPQGGTPTAQLNLADKAIATSGDYLQFFEVDGQRYSHLLDPRSGYPIDGNVTSVTVVADDAMTADALSTGLAVMGLRAGLAFAEQHRISAYFLYREDSAIHARHTTTFDATSTRIQSRRPEAV
jgi:thiamine biosynthesis lipoprotein